LCLVTEAILNQLGFSVLVTSGGNEAVDLFQKHQDSIDCLLTDLSMPDMDGWETLGALREIKPNLPVILSSGYDEAHVMDGDHDELPQAFLHKPYKRNDLRNALLQVLEDPPKNIK
jgi:two-component system cell cycle sensor histidine kinase/response regulator CckA